ncbi:hypothetical protein ABPG72_011412 [Tetrahymena utriculariae]
MYVSNITTKQFMRRILVIHQKYQFAASSTSNQQNNKVQAKRFCHTLHSNANINKMAINFIVYLMGMGNVFKKQGKQVGQICANIQKINQCKLNQGFFNQ